jgi:predicted PurR-regulated permease PerM
VGTVLLPWSLLCLLQQDTPRAIGLASTYLAVTLTRSMLEPKFLGRHLGLDPLVTLMALYIGFRLWGIGGMILAPILTVITLQIAHPQTTDS